MAKGGHSVFSRMTPFSMNLHLIAPYNVLADTISHKIWCGSVIIG